MRDLHVTPAYGRDYKSKAAALADWNAHKDFTEQPSGSFVNKEDADRGGFKVWIRYDKLRKIVEVPNG